MPGCRSASVPRRPPAKVAVLKPGADRARLLQLAQDVAHREFAGFGSRRSRRRDRGHARARRCRSVRHGATLRRRDALDHRVGLRVHRRGVERVVAEPDAQEAGALLEGWRAEARHLASSAGAAAERPVLVAVRHDRLRQRAAQARDAASSAAEALFSSTPTLFTQSSTTASRLFAASAGSRRAGTARHRSTWARS
jgi:hypothetical protein